MGMAMMFDARFGGAAVIQPKTAAGLKLLALVAGLVALFYFGSVAIKLYFSFLFFALSLVAASTFLLSAMRRALARNIAQAPSDEIRAAKAVKAAYWALMIKLTLIWLSFCLLTAYCAYALHFGLGKDWFPFSRTISIRRTDPLFDYTIFDFFLLPLGFLAITGLVWLPMYLLFEGIETSKKLKELKVGAGDA